MPTLSQFLSIPATAQTSFGAVALLILGGIGLWYMLDLIFGNEDEDEE